MSVHASLRYAAVLAGLLACSAGYAQYGTGSTTKPDPNKTTTAPAAKGADKAAMDSIEQTYKADKQACDAMKDNAKDICMAEAKGKEKVAKAELQYQKDPSDRNRMKLADTKAEANYDVAKEKCEDKAGNDREVCKKEAKAAETAAKAEAKGAKKTSASKG
jgi:hypothetical protein